MEENKWNKCWEELCSSLGLDSTKDLYIKIGASYFDSNLSKIMEDDFLKLIKHVKNNYDRTYYALPTVKELLDMDKVVNPKKTIEYHNPYISEHEAELRESGLTDAEWRAKQKAEARKILNMLEKRGVKIV